jgi:hypothetical protein
MHPTSVSCQIEIMIGDVERILSIERSSQDRSRLCSTSKNARIDLAAGIAELFLVFQSDTRCHPRLVLRQSSEKSDAARGWLISRELGCV